jgi:hypothetical protein
MEVPMTRLIISLLLLTLAVSGCVVDGGYGYGGNRGRSYGASGWSEQGGQRDHENNGRYRNWSR